MRWFVGLITVAAILATVKLLVSLLEPRMAFFPWQGIQETPATHGLTYADHTIATADGEKIHSWWMEHPSPRAQVVYWHGNGGNLSLWLDVVADIHRRGFSVLAVDYRGYGGSTGAPSEKGIYRDGEAATQYFNQRLRRQGSPVIVWGRSLGCAVASYTASRTTPDALILESPFPDVGFLFARNPVMRVLSIFSSYTFATSGHLERYDGPLLVVHGDRDSVIPFRAGRRVFERAATPRKTFVALEGADHNDVHTGHPAYWKAVDAFVGGLR
jgi:alpha-beta hydrolase superfamily lysophospholipase